MRQDKFTRGTLDAYIRGIEKRHMHSALDRIIVYTMCPTCGSRIGAPYVQVRSAEAFACGCGTSIGADLARIAAQADIGLAERDEPVAARSRPSKPIHLIATLLEARESCAEAARKSRTRSADTST